MLGIIIIVVIITITFFKTHLFLFFQIFDQAKEIESLPQTRIFKSQILKNQIDRRYFQL